VLGNRCEARGNRTRGGFSNIDPQAIQSIKKRTRIGKKSSNAPIETPEMLEAANQVRIQMMGPDEAGAPY
jgi:hypothetical protein